MHPHLFQFELKPIAECMLPQENNGVKNISWFWITDCCQYIQLGEVKLFQSSKESIAAYPTEPEYLDYYYVRFLEDFFDMLPNIAANLPTDLYRLLDEDYALLQQKTWDFLGEDEDDLSQEQEAVFDLASSLLGVGNLDTGHLRVKCDCVFYHTEDKMVIHYDFRGAYDDGIKVWSANAGKYEMRYTDFLDEVEDLLNRFFAAMDLQLEDAKSQAENGGYGYTTEEDAATIYDRLCKENVQRKESFFGVLNKVKQRDFQNSIDWGAVRQAITTILQ